MSVECGECERDLRGGHDIECPALRVQCTCDGIEDHSQLCAKPLVEGWRSERASFRDQLAAKDRELETVRAALDEVLSSLELATRRKHALEALLADESWIDRYLPTMWHPGYRDSIRAAYRQHRESLKETTDAS